MAPKTGLELIARQEWLAPVEDTLGKAVSGAYRSAGAAGQKIKNALHGTWLGHPLHPVLTDIPIGAWTVALVLDAMDAAHPNRAVAKGAEVAVCVGLTGAAGAAITGLTDWSDTDGRARRVGVVHGLLNVTATLLYTTSYLKRRGRSRGAARGFAFAGFAVACASAWLGGDLVYGEQIGVNHALPADAPPDFTPVLPETELQEQQMRRVEVNGVRVLLVRKDGRIHAMAETCSHLGGPLAEGKFDGECVQCPWHGSRFAIEDGSVVDGPATHPQPRYETRVVNGQIEIRAAK